MAQIKRVVRETPISNFQQGAPSGGGAFRLLADGLNDLYDQVAPVATEQMKQRGEKLGREAAKAQFGDARPYRQETSISGGGGSVGAAGGSYRDAIASIESAGSGDYRAIGPTNKKLGRALGRYQIMEANIGPWSKAALGREVSAEEFLADDDIQDQIFDHKFESYVSQFGEEGAAQAWFAGPGGVGKVGRKDVLGTSVGQYGDKFKAALGNTSLAGGAGNDTLAGQGKDITPPPAESATMVRTDSGALESRLYSPYSGPILQAHDAAARVAYQSEILNKSAVDLMDMSRQFPLDPDAFGQAAEKYIDTMVDSAPTDYQGELRATLSKEVQRRSFGMMEDRHKDIRARANNSSKALVERWSDGLTDAILTGDQNQIAEAQSELDSLLQAREALPGIAWTNEQSANVIIDARKRASVKADQRQKATSKQTKGTLDLIINGAKVGATVAGEEILSDPSAMADHPELAREAAAFVALRDNMPDFLEMTPSEQAAIAEQMAAGEVFEEWQLDIVDAVTKSAAANKKAWDDDPVKRAGEVMRTDPPPPMPEITLDDPNKIVEGLAARREYMNNLRGEGYTDTAAYLSEVEAEGLQSAMTSDTPPELRAALSGAIVAGFGPDAISVFNEIDADPITMYAGKMMALGGNSALAATILKGQQILDEGLVRVPPKADRIETFSTSTATAFQGVPGAVKAQAEVMATAQAIYAANPSARGIEPTSEAAKELMQASIQAALGQSTNKRGEVTGGVQEVMGRNTLLPIGVSGENADKMVRDALGGAEVSFFQRLSAGPGSMQTEQPSFDSAWIEASTRHGYEGSTPMHNGKPIPSNIVRDDNVRMIPAGPNGYRMEIMSGSSVIDVQDENGNVFFFDLQKLMGAME